MSTGYWWNGFSYESSRRDALLDQRWRIWWRDPATWRDMRFTVIAPFTAGAAALLPLAGVVAAVAGLGYPEPAARLAGACGVVLAAVCATYAWRLLAPVAVRFLGPSAAMSLADRVEELTAQRAGATVAEAAEIRRIERDLHDGAQARLVALGLSLATIERLMETDPAGARGVLREARAGATASLAELRELVRGISLPVLSERGLVDAVRALALDIPLDTRVTARLVQRLDSPVEAALYFGISELLTNAVKHAHASRALVCIIHDGPCLVVDVEDDGRGGVTVHEGGGIAGLRRRLAVFDGTVEIDSPIGGPTRIRMAVPCESL